MSIRGPLLVFFTMLDRSEPSQPHAPVARPLGRTRPGSEPKHDRPAASSAVHRRARVTQEPQKSVTHDSKRQTSATRPLRHAPVVVGAVAMVGYFAWVCLQMAPRTEGGDLLLAVIFGPIAAGTICAVAALWRRGR